MTTRDEELERVTREYPHAICCPRSFKAGADWQRNYDLQDESYGNEYSVVISLKDRIQELEAKLKKAEAALAEYEK